MSGLQNWYPPGHKYSEEKCLCIKCSSENKSGNRLNDLDNFRYACEKCGNKRCPHHSDHHMVCSGSNEPGQEGSVYE